MNDPARPDERCVSWKVLLPVEPETRILALGLDTELVIGFDPMDHRFIRWHMRR
jgi:hypothetical protein